VEVKWELNAGGREGERFYCGAGGSPPPRRRLLLLLAAALGRRLGRASVASGGGEP